MAARSFFGRLTRLRVSNNREKKSPLEAPELHAKPGPALSITNTILPAVPAPAYTPRSSTTPPRYFPTPSSMLPSYFPPYDVTTTTPTRSLSGRSRILNTPATNDSKLGITRTVASLTTLSPAIDTTDLPTAAAAVQRNPVLPYGTPMYADSEGSLGAEAMATLGEEDMAVYVEEALRQACEDPVDEPRAGRYWMITKEDFYANLKAAEEVREREVAVDKVEEWVEKVVATPKRPELRRRNAGWPVELENEFLSELEVQVQRF